MKKIEIRSGYMPDGKYEFNGEYIFKCESTREGAHGMKAPNLYGEVEGFGGINGQMELEEKISGINPLDPTAHKYFYLENRVWLKNEGNYKYVAEWTAEEKWGAAYEVTYDEAGNITAERALGFIIMRVNRKKGILF